ncbi:hypothetical protein RFI_24813, partial [Reticulomyxa filosa]
PRKKKKKCFSINKEKNMRLKSTLHLIKKGRVCEFVFMCFCFNIKYDFDSLLMSSKLFFLFFILGKIKKIKMKKNKEKKFEKIRRKKEKENKKK